MSAPTPADGRNCSTAMRIISSAMPEWMRRVRACISVPINAADSAAVEIQIARYAGLFLDGSGSQNACAPAAATAVGIDGPHGETFSNTLTDVAHNYIQ